MRGHAKTQTMQTADRAACADRAVIEETKNYTLYPNNVYFKRSE